MDGRRIISCLTLAIMKDGAEVTTVEGLVEGDALHPLQHAFIEHDAFQCGYCTPGQICSAVGLLHEGRAKSADDIRELMSGNICRCGAYPNIVAAIEHVMHAGERGREMNAFSYTRAGDVATAVREVAADGAAKFIAGGTNLFDLMKEHVERPSRLIDITRLPLADIRPSTDGGLRLGALVTNTDVAYDAQVERRYPLVSKAILAGASPQLRNMATVGGNLMQRTRCSTSMTRPRPATNASPGPAVPPSTASTACTRSWARARSASPSIRRTCAWRWLRWRRSSTSAGRAASALSPSPSSTACPAIRRTSTRTWPPTAHHGGRSASQGLRRTPRVPQGPRPHVLRLRAGVGCRGAGDGRRDDHGGASRAGRLADHARHVTVRTQATSNRRST